MKKEMFVKCKNYLGVLLLFCLVFLFLTESAQAIPTFARKYKTSCATCHSAFPRLNAVGEAYRLNGYRFSDEEIYIKDEPVEMGDDAYKRVWPEAIWPSDIPGLPPISVRVMNDFTSDIGGNGASRTTFDFPHEIELFMAGTFGDDMSFFTEIEFEAGLTDTRAWLTFDDVLGPENAYNIKVGNIDGGRGGLFTHRDNNRLTKEHYLYTDWQLPYPTAPSGTTYTKNTYRQRTNDPGIELFGFSRSWYYSAAITEGDTSLSEKDFIANLAYKIGGTGFDGSGGNLGDALTSSESWVDDSVTFAAWAQRGARLVNVSTSTPSSKERTDDFWRAGFSALCKSGDVQLGGGYFFGENANPYGTASTRGVSSHGLFVEVNYFYNPWVIPSLRFETRQLDIPGSTGLSDQDLGQIIASVKLLFRANVSLTLEGKFRTTDESASSGAGDLGDSDALFARLDFAF